ncbi:hypothetical protein ABTZ99_13515 [Actinosynnema sp. NPDC002837]
MSWTTNAPVISAMAGSVSAVAAAFSARAALRTARKTSATADAATRALALALRPIFNVEIIPQHAEAAVNKILLHNGSQFAAVDVMVEVRTAPQQLRQAINIPRVAPRPVNALQATVEVPVELPLLRERGDQHDLTVTVRFNDEQGLERWEQQYRLVRTLDDPNSATYTCSTRTSGGEVVAYKRT